MNRLRIFILGAVVGLAACGDTEPAPAADTSAAQDTGATADATPQDTSTLDTSNDDTTVPNDVSQPDTKGAQCAETCAPFGACEPALVAACESRCMLSPCESSCLAEATDCESAAACLDLREPLAPFHEGPYGVNPKDVADTFTLPTLSGVDFDFKAQWNGRDSYVFLMTQTGWEYGDQLWDSELFSWLKTSPDNVHYFFMVYPHKNEAEQTVDDAEARVTALRDKIEEKLLKIGLAYGKPMECGLRRRLHFVPIHAWSVGGWIQQMLETKGVIGFAIDRFQRLRELGLLAMVNGPPMFGHTRFSAEYYNFEFDREANLQNEGVTIVDLYKEVQTGGGQVTVELPSAEKMATFDTLEIDLTSDCPGHLNENCPEWDVGASMSVMEHPVDEVNPAADTPCQPAVAAVEQAAEVMGACGDGTACKADADCSDGGVCEGYQAPVEAVEAVAAGTLACSCAVPAGTTRESTQTCNAEGTGYADCSCNESIEVARWITTYGREGRWISDQSQMLAILKNGGKHRFSYSAGNSYLTTLRLRFYEKGGKDRAFKMVPLVTGGGFNPSYNGKYEPLEIDIPAEATRVELLAYITGHGWGAEKANCAEFCNHTHHFTLNGQEFVHDQPWVGNNYGCAMQVTDGVVPNQFGTWTLGRAGWCPGLDVKPFVADVTSVVEAGSKATLSYKGLYNGQDYTPEPSGSGKGFGANIWMNSWLVFYK